MIIIHKFRGKLRERFPEWITSIGIFWWGIVALALPALFNQTNYYPLYQLMSGTAWGVSAVVIGLASMLSLAINGLWRPSSHLRALCSIGKVILWSALLVGAATTESRQLGVPLFAMVMSLDIMALWWAAGDARIADDLAKNKKKVINGR